MKKYFKKLSLFLFGFVAMFGLVFAAENPDAITIEIKESLNVWETTDFTIAAMKNWEVFKEFSGMVFFWLRDSNWNMVDDDLFTVPNGGRYQFVATDQWKKTFSKWLEIKKAWTYTLEIDPIEWWKWEITLIVAWGARADSLESVLITYPVNASTETKSYVTVMWSCEKLKNSPVVIYLNNRPTSSGYTDARWNFNVFVPDLLSGNNEIQAKIVDINNVVLWESAVISVKYQSPQDGVFKSMEILPSKEAKQWDKMVFNVNTDDWVTSAQLIFSNGLKYSMDRIWQWLFSKELVTTFSGNIDVSVSLVENSNEKIYENIEAISVKENIAISNIKFTSTGVDGTQVVVSRDTIGSVPRYQINYGTWKTNLENSVTISSSTVLINNLKKDTSYFFQIIPMDLESHNSGDPSEIVEYHPAALSCIVKWIKVKKEQIWDNYYLVRDPVENITSYEVYRSDWADMTDARLVWSLTGTRFQYLFNPDAQKDEYAYYQVQALCPDGTNIIVDKAQKVKVWPVENMLLIIVISIFAYSIYRLHRLSEKEL